MTAISPVQKKELDEESEDEEPAPDADGSDGDRDEKKSLDDIIDAYSGA